MIELTIIGEAGATSHDDRLNEMDGISCWDDFAEYSDISKVESGYLSFRYREGKLYSVIDYVLSEELSEAELAELIDETQGQLSDGIGEGFEQQSCMEIDGEEVYISPWKYGQVLSVVK